MAKFDKHTLDRWSAMACNWLAANGFTVDQITTGRDAWTVAHRAGITAEAYRDRAVVDAHIQTALQAILPHAVFKDAKRY